MVCGVCRVMTAGGLQDREAAAHALESTILCSSAALFSVGLPGVNILIPVTGAHNRGVKHAQYYVLRNNPNPAVLIECGFLSSSMERQLLSNEFYRRRISWGIAAGILHYLKKEEPTVIWMVP